MEETRWKEKIKPLDENAMEEARGALDDGREAAV